MNAQAIGHSTVMDSPAYKHAVEKMRTLIMDGINSPIEGLMDSTFFDRLRDRSLARKEHRLRDLQAA